MSVSSHAPFMTCARDMAPLQNRPHAPRLAESAMAATVSLPRRCLLRGHCQSVFGLERNDEVRRLGCVGLQAIRIGLAPVGEIHHLRRLGYRPRGLGRLKDVEPIAIEEKRVLPEQAVELPTHGVVVWNGIALKLSQSSLDLCGREFHRTLLLRSSLWIKLVSIELAAPTLAAKDNPRRLPPSGGQARRWFIPRAHRQLCNADADGWLLL